jgi:hypothetical protein
LAIKTSGASKKSDEREGGFEVDSAAGWTPLKACEGVGGFKSPKKTECDVEVDEQGV